MAVLRNRLVDYNGNPVAKRKVRVELVTTAGWLKDEDAEAVQDLVTQTNSNGDWEITLLPNSAYATPNTYYLVQEHGVGNWSVLIPADEEYQLADVYLDEIPPQVDPQSHNHPQYATVEQYQDLENRVDVVEAATGTGGVEYVTETELNTAIATRAERVHGHAQGEISGLSASLNEKADQAGTQTALDSVNGRVDNLDANSGALDTRVTALESRSVEAGLTQTQADERYYPRQDLDPLLAGKSDKDTTDTWIASVEGRVTTLEGQPSGGGGLTEEQADVLYYPRTELDPVLSGKASTSTTDSLATRVTSLEGQTDEVGMTQADGDVRYYQQGQVDTLLTGKADSSHAHYTADISGLDTTLDDYGTRLTAVEGATSNAGMTQEAADARYYQRAEVDTQVGALDTRLDTVEARPVVDSPDDIGAAPSSHSHTTAQVTGLDTALTGKSDTNHTHSTAQVTGLDSALSEKAATSHTHTTSQVTGLDTALSGKASTSHGHSIADVANLQTTLGTKADTSSVQSTTDSLSQRIDVLEAAEGGNAGNWQPVTTRGHVNPHFLDPTTGQPSRNAIPTSFSRFGRTLRRVSTSAVEEIRVEWRNVYNQVADPGEVVGPNTMTIRASVEYPAGEWKKVNGSTTWSSSATYAIGDQVVFNSKRYVCTDLPITGVDPGFAGGWTEVKVYPVHWTGEDVNRVLSVEPGQAALSEVVSLQGNPLRAGFRMAVNMQVSSGTSTGKIITGSDSYAGDFVLDYATTPTAQNDLVDQPVTNQTTAATGTPIPLPTVVLGNSPDHNTITTFGDSLFQGLYDTNMDNDAGGFIPRALRNVQWQRMSVAGGRADAAANQNTPWKTELLKRHNIVLTDLGGNDAVIGDGTSNISSNLTMVQTRMKALWQYLASYTPHVWATTITPWTASSDNWATTANQTRANNIMGGTNGLDGVWGQLRTWFRDGCPMSVNGRTVRAGEGEHPLSGVIDVGYAVIDPVSGWKWKAGLTTDGMHPNATGHDLMGRALYPYLPALARGGRIEDLPAGSFAGEWQSSTGVVQEFQNTTIPVNCLSVVNEEARGCTFNPATGTITVLVDGEWSFEPSTQWTGGDTSIRWVFMAPPDYNPSNPAKRYGANGNSGSIEVLSSSVTVPMKAGQQMTMWVTSKRTGANSGLWGTGGSTSLRAIWRGRRRELP